MSSRKIKYLGAKMRKVIVFLLLFSTLLFAQRWHRHSNDYVYVPFNLGLWPGVSIGDMMAEETGKDVYNNGFALSLIGMRAARLNGVNLSGIFSIYREQTQGVMLSGIFNLTNNDFRGLQGAGIFNMVNGSITGLQASGIFSIQNGNFKGLQASGIFNVQNGDFKGVQGTGVFSIQNGDFKGLQVSDVFNIGNGDFKGMQVGSAFNILNGRFNGLQISGALNIVRYFESGVQIGLVNIAERHDGVPIGLFTYVEGVPISYQVWYDDMQFVHLAVRSGNEKWYNQVILARRIEGDTRYHQFGGGFGRNIYLGRDFSMDVGISASKLLDDEFKGNGLGYLAKFNLLFHYDLEYESSIFFGPTINFSYSKLAIEDLSQNPWVDEKDGDYFYRIWPGFVVGLKL
jgi:hypothetical protein